MLDSSNDISLTNAIFEKTGKAKTHKLEFPDNFAYAADNANLNVELTVFFAHIFGYMRIICGFATIFLFVF